MKRLCTLVTGIGLMFFLHSCKDKQEDPKPQEPKPEGTILSPKAHQMYNYGDTVFIRLTATAPKDFHGYDLDIRNALDTSKILFAYDMHLHNDTIQVDTFWVNNVTEHTQGLLSFSAAIDHNGNFLRKEVNIHCHPQ